MKLLDTEFEHSKFDQLDGKTCSMWRERSNKVNPFSLRVTTEGLHISGELSVHLSSEGDFRDFAELIGKAMEEARRMRPKLLRNLAGHE